MRKLKIYFFLLILCGFSDFAAAQVITVDAKDTAQQSKLLYDETAKAAEAVSALQESLLSLVDIGEYLDLALSFDFSIPKPEMSSDVVNAIPKTNGSAVSGATGQITQATDSVAGGVVGTSGTGGISGIGGTSGSGNQKFASKSAVQQSVTQNMQVRTDETAEDKDVVSMATGSGDSATTQEISRKRAQLAQSKQVFARYGLATALVHRTLAYRAIAETKGATEDKTGETTATRKTHEGKMYGNMRMAETYNRVLMSQAVANGLSGFSALDEIEGRVDFNLRGITDNLSGGGLTSGLGLGL